MSDDVACTSVPAFDGWTGERIGWMYGTHIFRNMPPDGKCPRCGLALGTSGEQMLQNLLPNSVAQDDTGQDEERFETG